MDLLLGRWVFAGTSAVSGTASLQQGAVQVRQNLVWPHRGPGLAKRLLDLTQHRARPCPGLPSLQPSA